MLRDVTRVDDGAESSWRQTASATFGVAYLPGPGPARPPSACERRVGGRAGPGLGGVSGFVGVELMTFLLKRNFQLFHSTAGGQAASHQAK